MMIDEEQTSGAAIWCQRFAVFLIPYFLLVIPLYRFNKIDTTQLFSLLGIGLLIALIALIFALRAGIELWNDGVHGGSQLVRGALISLLALVPFLYFGFQAVQLPLANDVATDPFSPPQYVAAIAYRDRRSNAGMNPVFEYTPEYAQQIVAAYPQLQARRYPAAPERVYDAVIALIRESGWPVTSTQGLPEPAAATETDETPATQANEALEDNELEAEDILVEFVERTLILGFENDVVVRIASENNNTIVDMRSSSRWGQHDFGYNTTLINRFLSRLDESLLGIAGEG